MAVPITPKSPLVVGSVTFRASQPTPLAPPARPVSSRPVTQIARPVVSTGTLLKRAANVSTATHPAALSSRSQIELFDASELTQSFFRCVLYAETSRRKSTTAALFGDPDDVRIVLLRRKEQMLPLRDLGYKRIAYCRTLAQAQEALSHPEKLWPEWADRPERVLILDDLTQLKDMLLDDSETFVDANGNEREVKDARMVHKQAKDAMKDIVRGVLDKPMHFICVAMAATYPSQIDGNERIWPDLPPKMGNMIDTDFEFVLYIDEKFQLVVQETSMQFKYTDPKTQKEGMKLRTIFAKNKLPLQYCRVGPGEKPLLGIKEPLDLRAFWAKVQTAEKGR